MQLFIKLSRIACGPPFHLDNYIDAAAYLGIAAECEAITRHAYATSKSSSGDGETGKADQAPHT
jgi:hypothetical protein